MGYCQTVKQPNPVSGGAFYVGELSHSPLTKELANHLPNINPPVLPVSGCAAYS